jgi:hypothetical protein
MGGEEAEARGRESGGEDLGVVSGGGESEQGGVAGGGEGLKVQEGGVAGREEMEGGLWACGGFLMVALFFRQRRYYMGVVWMDVWIESERVRVCRNVAIMVW